MAFLPLASSGGLFFLLTSLKDDTKPFFAPLGVFGFLITFGLLAYEIFGLRKCHALVQAGGEMGIIYPAVLAAWAYIALIFNQPQAAVGVAVVVFLVTFASLFGYELHLRKSTRRAADQYPGNA